LAYRGGTETAAGVAGFSPTATAHPHSSRQGVRVRQLSERAQPHDALFSTWHKETQRLHDSTCRNRRREAATCMLTGPPLLASTAAHLHAANNSCPVSCLGRILPQKGDRVPCLLQRLQQQQQPFAGNPAAAGCRAPCSAPLLSKGVRSHTRHCRSACCCAQLAGCATAAALAATSHAVCLGRTGWGGWCRGCPGESCQGHCGLRECFLLASQRVYGPEQFPRNSCEAAARSRAAGQTQFNKPDETACIIGVGRLSLDALGCTARWG
jgi:hypothetical protein